MFADTNVESSEPIQPDTIGVSSAFPSPQIETTTEKVFYPLHRLSYHKLIQSSKQDLLIYRYLILQLQAILSILNSI